MFCIETDIKYFLMILLLQYRYLIYYIHFFNLHHCKKRTVGRYIRMLEYFSRQLVSRIFIAIIVLSWSIHMSSFPVITPLTYPILTTLKFRFTNNKSVCAAVGRYQFSYWFLSIHSSGLQSTCGSKYTPQSTVILQWPLWIMWHFNSSKSNATNIMGSLSFRKSHYDNLLSFYYGLLSIICLTL